MAVGTIASLRSIRELAGMRVLMTIGAELVRNGIVEVFGLMTTRAGNVGVLPFQREARVRVTESLRRPVCLPARRVVACIAAAVDLRILKCTAVRVPMAVLTGIEAHPFKGHSG